jgi:cysteine desulfurase
VGAIYIRKGVEIEPFMHGGGQEMGVRSGTENVILNVGLGKACELILDNLYDDMSHLRGLRDRLHNQILSAIPEAVLNGHPEQRLPNTLNVSFPGLIGEEILRELPDLCVSTGAACHDRSLKLSHVLEAMGVSEEVGMGAVRISLGRPTTETEVDQAARLLGARIKERRP